MFSNFIKWLTDLWKNLLNWIKSWCKQKRPIVRINIMSIVLFLFLFSSPSFAQRPNLQYVFVSLHQDSIEKVQSYTVHWNNSISDSLTINLLDTANAKVWFNSTWMAYQSGMNVDSVRLLVPRPIEYDTEYTFRVVANNPYGRISSDSVLSYFIVSDINFSKSVDGLDLIRLAKKWGYGGLGYRDWEDINGDGYVDGLDLIKMSKEWGRTWIP